MSDERSGEREKETGVAVSLLCALIAVYRATVSRLLPEACRFYPSCSVYASMSLKKYGIVRGTAKAIRRVARCAPWSDGGIDYP